MLRIPYPFLIVCAIVLMSCDSNKIQELTVDFQLKWRGELTRCLDVDSGIDGLAFFVSEFALNGLGETPLDLLVDESVHNKVALIRFDTCEGHSDKPTLKFLKPTSDYGSLSFNVGLPFELNHQNPIVQPSPLNVGSMFWTWRLGYKFLRLDMAHWSFHLGSGGCVSPSAVRAPKQFCKKPNLARVTVNITRDDPVTITFDLDQLLDNRPEGDTTNCMDGFYEKPSCTGLIESLGLWVGEGTCVNNCEKQRVFY